MTFSFFIFKGSFFLRPLMRFEEEIRRAETGPYKKGEEGMKACAIYTNFAFANIIDD